MRDKKNDRELLSNIQRGFEASGKHLSDDFFNDKNLFADKENAEIKHRKVSWFHVTAACTAVAAVAMVVMVNRFTDRDRIFTAELSENEMTSQTTAVSEVTEDILYTEYSKKTLTSAVTYSEDEKRNEQTNETGAVTEVFEERTETSEMKNPASAVTEITVQPDSTVKPSETVTLALTEAESVKPSEVTKAELPLAPADSAVLTTPEKVDEDVTVSEDMEVDSPEIYIPEETEGTKTDSPVTGPVFVPDSEKTERVIRFVSTVTEECVRPDAVYEDERFIYTVREPDSFLVSVKYSLTGKEFLYTLHEAVSSGEFTISELAEAGLPNCVVSPK